MKALKLFLCVAMLITGVSCSRDPEVVKRKYLESGNRYFAAGKYKEASIMYRNAIRKDRKFGEAYYRLAQTELKLGQLGPAYRDFVRASDSDPNNIDAKIQAATIGLGFYISMPSRGGAFAEESKRYAEEVLKRRPDNTDALRVRGYYKLVVAKDAEAAYTDFKRGFDLKPYNPEITLPLVQTLFTLKRDAEGEKLCRELLDRQKQNLVAYALLYRHYAQGGRLAEAEKILLERVANNPKDSGGIIQLAAHYSSTNRPDQANATIQRLVDNPKDFPDGRMLAGQFYFRTKNLDAAKIQFEEGAKRGGPDRALYLRSLATVLIAQRRPKEAQAVLDSVIKEFPKDEDAKALRASLQIETGDPKQIDAAIRDIEAGVKENPKNAVTRFNYARALIAKKEYDQARTQLQEASKLAPDYLAPRLALAELHYVKGEYGLARQVAREILDKVDKDNLAAKLLESSALASAGDRQGARRAVEEILKQHPGLHDAEVQMAILDLGEKKFPQAEQAFAKLYKENQTDLRGLMGLVETYAAQKKFDVAIGILKSELAKHPERQPLKVALGNLSFRSGKVPEAIQHFEELAKLNPNSADLQLKLAECYRIKGDIPKAEAAYQRARGLQPNDPLIYLQMGMLYDSLGRRSEAKPMYEQVLRLQPDNPLALNNLAYLVAETGGDLDQALSMAQRAKQRLPNQPDVADTLGWIYIKKNLSDNAIQVLRDLVSKQPDRSTYRYHLGLALYQKGDKAAARRELSAALQQKPSKEEEGKIRELLGKIG